MKSTIKVVLAISLLLSTAVFTYADGDQEDGNRCTTCSSFAPDPEFSVATQQPSETIGSEAPRAAAKITNEQDTFDDELLTFLRIWFNSLLG